jgi:hypothetical protein
MNFDASPKFFLGNELNRPIFVNPSAIFPGTGSVAAVASRRIAGLGRVTTNVSDLRGHAAQLTVYAIPRLPLSLGLLTLGYTFSSVTSDARGFDQTTATDPRVVERSRDRFSPSHQFVMQFARGFRKVGLTAFLRAASGYRFTPVIGSDINGDGFANDRAFVFNPARESDPSLAGGLEQLLVRSSPPTRKCLNSQLGKMAEPSSCVGPWRATFNANLWLVPALPLSARRATARLSFLNVLGGVDRLVHGGNSLHGWGSIPTVDPVLYRVKGFDTVTRQFLYQVNPEFGIRRLGSNTFSTPFRIALEVSIDLGRSPQRQALVQNLRLRPGLVGTRAPVDSLKTRYMRQNFTDVYAVILQMADSMALSRSQIDSLQEHSAALRSEADSVYSGLATYLTSLPDNYDEEAALRTVTVANDEMWRIIFSQKELLLTLLSPGQVRLLPPAVFQMLTVPGYNQRFFFGP